MMVESSGVTKIKYWHVYVHIHTIITFLIGVFFMLSVSFKPDR